LEDDGPAWVKALQVDIYHQADVMALDLNHFGSDVRGRSLSKNSSGYGDAMLNRIVSNNGVGLVRKASKTADILENLEPWESTSIVPRTLPDEVLVRRTSKTMMGTTAAEEQLLVRRNSSKTALGAEPLVRRSSKTVMGTTAAEEQLQRRGSKNARVSVTAVALPAKAEAFEEPVSVERIEKNVHTATGGRTEGAGAVQTSSAQSRCVIS
jgi:hypothetical protein